MLVFPVIRRQINSLTLHASSFATQLSLPTRSQSGWPLLGRAHVGAFFCSGEGLHHQDFHLADVEEDAGTVAPGADEAVRRQRRSADQRPTGKSNRFSVSLN